MQSSAIKYIEPVFRPPSEGNSLIIQVTNGCSWNKCTFCEMYTSPMKKFKARKDEEIIADLMKASLSYAGVRRVFLADGDAMVLPTQRLLTILKAIKGILPSVTRVSAYCLPKNLKKKSVRDLRLLKEAGLGILYVGAESGDDFVLEKINKGETYASTAEAVIKVNEAGIKSSMMILNGLGGKKYSAQHAINTARLLNECQPSYAATLVVGFPLGIERFKDGWDGDFELLDQESLFREIELMLNETQLNNTIFRSDHASNYLVLKGVLGKDKAKLLQQVREAIVNPEGASLREEWQRGM
ncbi:MAG: radical SAM protein [Gammaproteobacteria bacterium]|nr:radical SAM protein [Gammaproteobacteria bacterium]